MTATARRPIRVLVADNSDEDRAAIVAAVRAADPTAEVIEAHDGREAAALIRKHRPELSILDVYMAPGTGSEAADVAHRLGLEARLVSSMPPLSERRASQTTSKSDAPGDVAEWVAEAAWTERHAPPQRRPRGRLTWWPRMSTVPQ